MDQKKIAPAGGRQELEETKRVFVPETSEGPCTGGQGKEHYSKVSK